MYSLIRISFILLLFSSCTHDEKECFCTFEYSPVCSNGIQFDNKCIASCNNAKEVIPGKCTCNKDSGEVCATPAMKPCPDGMMCNQVMPTPKIFENECSALKNRAQIINMSNCR